MFPLLGGLKDLIKRTTPTTDNALFRLHYTFTTVLLIACSVIITANQYIGNPIECINDGDVPIHVINTYCWITTTFTMPGRHGEVVGKNIASPGVANPYSDGETMKDAKYHTYYQWVCFILFFQAALCYVPKWLWDMWEQGLLETIMMGLNAQALQDEETKGKKKKGLMKYMVAHIKVGNKGSQNEYQN